MSALPPKLGELADGLEETRRATFTMVSGLSERDFTWRPEGEWSVAQILEHLILSEVGTSKVIRKMPLYEWPAVTIGSHERDHQAQIAGILRALRK